MLSCKLHWGNPQVRRFLFVMTSANSLAKKDPSKMSEKQKGLCATSASSETEYPSYGSSNYSVSSTSTPPSSFERTFPDERFSPPAPCSSARQLESKASRPHCLESTDRKDQREASGFEGASSQPARSNSSQKRVEVKLEEALKRNNELEKKIRELTEQVSRMKEIEQQNERLKRKLVRIEGKQSVRLDTTLQEKDKLDEEKKQLECLYENTKQKLEQLEKEKQVLHEALKDKDHLKGNLQQLSAEMDAKTKQLEDKLKDLADVQEHCKQLKNDCDILTKERNEIQSKLEATCEDLKARVEEAKIELVIAEVMHTELEGKHTQQINELEGKLTESEEACQELEGERNELRTHVILVDGENAKLTQDNENLTQNLTKKEEEYKKLTTTVTKLTSELNAMSRHVGVEKEEKQAVGSELKTVEADRDKYLQQRDVARRSLALRNEKFSALEAQTRERQAHNEAEIRRLRVELSESNSERLRLMALSSPPSSLAEQPQANGTPVAGSTFSGDPRFRGTPRGFNYSSGPAPPGGQSPAGVHTLHPSNQQPAYQYGHQSPRPNDPIRQHYQH